MEYVMQLYFSPGACSLASHITAREAGLSLDLKRADTKTKKLEDGSDYFAINSKGAVPALKLDNGQVLTEGVAIMQYLADQKPESGPRAEERHARALSRSGMAELRHQRSAQGLLAALESRRDQAVKDYALTNLKKRFDWLNKQLTGKKYLTGDTFTVADAYLFVVMNWTKPLNIDLAAWPAIQEFQARVFARPKVQEAMEAEGLTKKAA
jgi:glutathione S-transferase